MLTTLHMRQVLAHLTLAARDDQVNPQVGDGKPPSVLMSLIAQKVIQTRPGRTSENRLQRQWKDERDARRKEKKAGKAPQSPPPPPVNTGRMTSPEVKFMVEYRCVQVQAEKNVKVPVKNPKSFSDAKAENL